MRVSSKGIACFVLAIFMFFSGMCLEYAEADSSFVYGIADKVVSYISSYEAEMSETEVCNPEVLGSRTLACLQQTMNRSMYHRRNMKISLEFLYTDEESKSIFNSFAIAGIVHLPKLRGEAVVLNYIHSQDGKKRG